MPHVAIVGAGISGLAAAERLRGAGIGVTVFEKSRGVGGRMATRRAAGMQFDHGAQFFAPLGQRFRDVVAVWRRAGQAEPWFEDAFVGTPAMTAPARALAAGKTVVTDCLVSALGRDENGWSVHGPAGPIAAPGNGRFGAVVLAVPAPQAAPLAASAEVDLPELERVRYAPCWALMLAFDEPGAAPDRSARGIDETIAWFARDASKPGRAAGSETFVVHASPDWSRANLERTGEDVAAELAERFLALVGSRRPPSFALAHRWRYALVEASAGIPCLWDPSSRLGACGDWCLGPRIEAAFDSGEAVAATIAAALAPRSPAAAM